MKVNSGPLGGCRVVDFTWAAMGPYAGYLLAALGAEVIQVSRPLKNSSSTTAAITQFFDVGKTCVKSQGFLEIIAGDGGEVNHETQQACHWEPQERAGHHAKHRQESEAHPHHRK